MRMALAIVRIPISERGGARRRGSSPDPALAQEAGTLATVRCSRVSASRIGAPAALVEHAVEIGLDESCCVMPASPRTRRHGAADRAPGDGRAIAQGPSAAFAARCLQSHSNKEEITHEIIDDHAWNWNVRRGRNVVRNR